MAHGASGTKRVVRCSNVTIDAIVLKIKRWLKVSNTIDAMVLKDKKKMAHRASMPSFFKRWPTVLFVQMCVLLQYCHYLPWMPSFLR
jgi:hypothetical protein